MIKYINSNEAIVLPFNGNISSVQEYNVKYKSTSNSDERYFETCFIDNIIKYKVLVCILVINWKKALSELSLQHTDLFDIEKAKEVGKFVGAQLIFIIEGYIGHGYNYLFSDHVGCTVRLQK